MHANAHAHAPCNHSLIARCVQRDFELVGEAATSELLPLDRRRALPAGRGAAAQLYVKPILELDASVDAPAGKRIGF